jgi:hypothetical protein
MVRLCEGPTHVLTLARELIENNKRGYAGRKLGEAKSFASGGTPGAKRPNDPSSATRSAGRVDGNRSAMAGSLQRMVRRLRHHFLLPLEPFQSATVTRKKVAGMDVASLRGLWFWRLNSSSSSFCKSAARPFFSAASKAFMVGP